MNTAEIASLIVFALWEIFWLFFGRMSARKGKSKVALSWLITYETIVGSMLLANVFSWYVQPASTVKSDLRAAVGVLAVSSLISGAMFIIVSLQQQRIQTKL